MGSSPSALKDTSKKRVATTSESVSNGDQAAGQQSLGQWKLLRVIGKGAFGKVRVVQDKDGNYFALKYINKETCIARQSMVNVLRERAILAGLDHPLVVRLQFAFQDTDHLYFVSELMLGGDLRYHIVRNTFTEDAVRHWIAEIASALSYVHARGIVHRDVKPDNILLDVDGHTKLADFNISTQARPERLPKSRSGTMSYMAPEVHNCSPYDGSADYWSLGITMYECIYGTRPIHGADATEFMQKTNNGEIQYPRTLPAVSSECVAAISALLQVAPSKRMDKDRMSSHAFFTTLSWDALDSGTSQPVYKPAPKSFDVTWELEDLLLEEAPLDARRYTSRREQSQRGNGSRAEGETDMYALLNDHFADYDRSKTPERLAIEQLGTAVSVLSPTDTPELRADELAQKGFFPVQTLDSGTMSRPQSAASATENNPQQKAKGTNWLLTRCKRKKRSKSFAPGVLLNKPGGRTRQMPPAS